jgi:putative N-acetylmannosamine-6-phosphate epimerase
MIQEKIMKEKLNYKILQEFKQEQDKFIAEGMIQKPQIVYGLSQEGKAAVKSRRTLEIVT